MGMRSLHISKIVFYRCESFVSELLLHEFDEFVPSSLIIAYLCAFEHLSLEGNYTGVLQLNHMLQIIVSEYSSSLKLILH